MRFEIKSGGAVAIVFGIAALSGAVFMLGLLAGYDVGRESKVSAAQVATAYPVAAPPAGSSTPVEPAAATSTAANAIETPAPAAVVSPVARPPAAGARHPASVAHATTPASTPSKRRLAREAPSPTSAMSTPETNAGTGEEASGSPARAADHHATAKPVAREASEKPAPQPTPRHKPYNIQIEAAMDRAGADEMVRRLRALGYKPHVVPTRLNGETWYKLVIGPYPTQASAAAAQQQMRTKYNSRYGGGRATGAGTRP
jgi:DedD protein